MNETGRRLDRPARGNRHTIREAINDHPQEFLEGRCRDRDRLLQLRHAGCGPRAARAPQRLPVKVDGKRVLTVDVHAHCYFHEAINLMGDAADKVLPPVKGVPEHFIVIEQRLKEMDAMAIDMEVLSINPFWYRKDRDTADADRQDQQREARRAVRIAAGPLRGLRLAAAAVPGSRGAAARDRDQEAGPARRRDRRQRAGRGFRRPEVPPGLGQGRRARRGAVHPSAEHAGARPSASRATAGCRTRSAIRSTPRSRCST